MALIQPSCEVPAEAPEGYPSAPDVFAQALPGFGADYSGFEVVRVVREDLGAVSVTRTMSSSRTPP